MKQIMDAAENVDFAVIGDAEKLQENWRIPLMGSVSIFSGIAWICREHIARCICI